MYFKFKYIYIHNICMLENMITQGNIYKYKWVIDFNTNIWFLLVKTVSIHRIKF